MDDFDKISKMTEMALNLCADKEAKHDITSWSMNVKRANRGSFHVRGEFVNHFLDKAFDKDNKDIDQAIQAAKNTLWYAFVKCYKGEIDK